MPVYDKKCNKCDELFEVVSKIADKDLPKECPYCGSVDSGYIPVAPMYGTRADRLMGTNNKDTGFKEVIQKIKERHPISPLAKDN